MMKKHLFSLLLSVMLVACAEPYQDSSDSNFRMHLRLWPAHHNDTELQDQLIDALKEYPSLWDDAWLCMETNTISMDAHRVSAQNMGRMAARLREVGVEPSVQGISLGHGDSFDQQSSAFNPTAWSATTGILGEECLSTHCPRQEEFLEYIAAAYEEYARNSKPRVVWIDDDLRTTNHSPARAICCCEDCIAEFNKTYGGSWTRSSLIAALDASPVNTTLRQQWIEFSQQSLAMVAAAIARGVHRGSPSSKVGLQHAGFHRELLEGRDWNMIFDSIEAVTGQVPTSRPGHGVYNDHAPREMIFKAYDIARQVRRLNPNITEIACEIEGYQHWATGKSPHGICVESMLYMAAGVTQLSYAVICSATEPMEWYKDNYFKALSRWRGMFEDYAAFNQGTTLGGLDPYISPEMVMRDAPNMGWITSGNAGDVALSIAPLGVPYAPDATNPSGYALDATAVKGIPYHELQALIARGGIIFDQAAWEIAADKGLGMELTEVKDVAGVGTARCYTNGNGGRCVVIPAYTLNISNAERVALLRAMDWASQNRLPVIMESMAQAVVMPRVDEENNLRSVLLLNCSISEQMSPTTLRLRGCGSQAPRLMWHTVGNKAQRVQAKRDGEEWIADIPPLQGWYVGWLSVER